VISLEQINSVLGDGRVVTGADGVDLGRIGRVLVDTRSGQPAWMSVTGDAWDGAVVVPLVLARMVDGTVSVPYSSLLVQGAPRAGAGEGRLGRGQEEEVVRHYGLDPAGTTVQQARREWRLPCTAHSLRLLRLELAGFLDVAGLPDEELEDLVLAASEAVTNAIEHAQTPAPGFFDVLADVQGTRVEITVRDYGRWRDPTTRGRPGHGLLLMRNLSALTVTVEPRGTTVTLQNRSADRDRWSFRRRR
jgi:anti-sigma regulatory factor (Ser/Thr protein kinase)